MDSSLQVSTVHPAHSRKMGRRVAAVLKRHRVSIGMGSVCGLLLWTTLVMLGLLGTAPLDRLESSRWAPLLSVACGAVVAATPGRRLLWLVTVLASTLFLFVVSTPVTTYGLRAVLQAEAPQHADAVVVLTGSVRQDGEPGMDTELRLLRAYELLHEGYAPRLVITRLRPPSPSHLPIVKTHMQRLGLDWPVEEAPGWVRNTHDESLAVARLIRERHWSRVLLVTQPTHCRRAAAVFRKTGVTLTAVPCLETRYDLDDPGSPTERLAAFSDLARELIGLQAYRLRGWI